MAARGGARASVVVLTGAGISADSGLATFRGAGGLWEGHRVEDVATPEAWARDPRLVWRFYQLRRAALLSGVQPNAGHRALARLERELRERGASFLLATQNVDDLHERAGSHPLHVHGELLSLACGACGARGRDVTSLDPDTFVPCRACGHPRLRPDVVWFGEVPRGLDELALAAESCTLFLAAGTSGAVYPAAGFLALARDCGARTVVTGLEPPLNLGPRDTFRRGRAAEVLPALVDDLLAEL